MGVNPGSAAHCRTVGVVSLSLTFLICNMRTLQPSPPPAGSHGDSMSLAQIGLFSHHPATLRPPPVPGRLLPVPASPLVSPPGGLPGFLI